MSQARPLAGLVDIEAQLGQGADHRRPPGKPIDRGRRSAGDGEQRQLARLQVQLGEIIALTVDDVAAESLLVVILLWGNPAQWHPELD